VVTVLAGVSCLADIQYDCLLKPVAYVFAKCDLKAATDFEWATLHANVASDLVTDAMIISIPILLLWNVRISTRKRIGLFGLFSLTITTMIFSIIRVTLVSTGTQANVSWLYTWGNVEVTVSIIVACLGSFRQLFVKSEGKSSYNSGSNGKGMSLWQRGFGSLGRKTNNQSSSFSKPGKFGMPYDNSSTENIVQLDFPSADAIRVRNDFNYRSDFAERGLNRQEQSSTHIPGYPAQMGDWRRQNQYQQLL